MRLRLRPLKIKTLLNQFKKFVFNCTFLACTVLHCTVASLKCYNMNMRGQYILYYNKKEN
jgi:hypothetical protein